MRYSKIERNTAETQISLVFSIDGTGKAEIDTGVGFLDHMLELFTKHGKFDMTVFCKGDTYVDDHHSVEDIGIALGQAFREALGDKRGIRRYGDIILPMDEALVMAAADVSGRACLRYTAQIPSQKIGTFDTELVREFFEGFVRNAGINLHIRMLDGENSHHIIEGMFKAFGRVLRKACEIDENFADEIPSTKGVLE